MLDAMGHLLRDVGWSKINDGALVHNYTTRRPSIGLFSLCESQINLGITSPIILDKNGDRMGEFSVQVQRETATVDIMTIDLLNATVYNSSDLVLVR